MHDLCLLCAIVKRDHTELMPAFFQTHGINTVTSLLCEGTAGKKLLDLLGLEETEKDFAFLNSLPGRKLILKGNHDYWWSTRSKIEAFFAEKGFDTLEIVFNSAVRVGDITVCGTRGWLYNAETAEDRKIVARENGRLVASLKAAQALGGTPVVFLHYPPVYDTAECTALLDTMLEYGVKDCYFGHIHGDYAAKRAPIGEYRGIKMNLISCDYIRFVPKLVRTSQNL